MNYTVKYCRRCLFIDIKKTLKLEKGTSIDLFILCICVEHIQRTKRKWQWVLYSGIQIHQRRARLTKLGMSVFSIQNTISRTRGKQQNFKRVDVKERKVFNLVVFFSISLNLLAI